MTYQPPPLINTGDPITSFVLNRYRLGLTQWEQFFDFSGTPDVKFTHRPVRFFFWSYEAASLSETLQFNAADTIRTGGGVFVVMSILNVNVGIGGGVGQTFRPSSGSQPITISGSTLRLYANGDVTLQHNTNALRKTAVLLVAL